ncbi:hypothetical protein D6R80_24080 [Salmonella enterica subsp. enterica serovar Kentucky]|nr:hypothetical protein [Salmonella enterica subsp. enterica serovar Kentucky]
MFWIAQSKIEALDMGAVISCRRTRYCVGAGCGEVQIWTPEGNRPGGHLTRHRQQLNQVIASMR